MLTLLSNFVPRFAAEESTGIGALGFSASSLVIQLVTFGLAYLILRKYAFGPILKVLQARRDTIEKGVRLGEEMQQERLELSRKVTAELHKARAEADAIVSDAQATAKSTVREAEADARNKAAGIVKDAEANADQAINRARKALETELVGLISDATEAIIDEKVDAKKDAVLIDKALSGQRA